MKDPSWPNCARITARGCLPSRSQVLLSIQNGSEILGSGRSRVFGHGGRLFTDDALRCSSVDSASDWLSNDFV